MSDKIYFCSCIPRSGSTLLLNLLAQNPAIHATPTNDLAELIFKIRDIWADQIAFRAQGLKQVSPRILKTMKGMVSGFYSNELSKNKIIIDKSRTWIGYIELLEEIFEKKIRIIVPVRPIEDVLTSFEKITRKSSLTQHTQPSHIHALRQTIIGRCQSHLAPEATLGMMLIRLRDALYRGLMDRLLIVPYQEFTNSPIHIVKWLSRELNLPDFSYNINNVTQIIKEDDTVYGMELHKIREGRIEPGAINTWRDILPEPFVKWVQAEYEDINNLSKMRI